MTKSGFAPRAATPLRADAAVIGLVGLAHASSHFGHLLLTPLFPFFMRDFGLSYAELGFLMTVFFTISGVGQACAGFVVDRLGARPLLFVALALFALACFGAALVQGYAGLLGVAAVAGLANATFHPVDFTILNQRVSPQRLGYAFSAHGLTGNLGWAAAPVFLVGGTALGGWRHAYVAAGIMFVLILLVMAWQRDKLRTKVVKHAPDAPREHDLAFMRLPVVWWCFGFFFFATMTLAVVQSYSVSILTLVHGVSLEDATLTLSAFMLCGAVGMFIGGVLAARARHSDHVVALAMSAAAVLLVLASTGGLGAAMTMGVLALTGFAVGLAGPSRDMMIKKATPQGATGRVYGLVYSGLDLGLAVAPLIFGVFMDRGWYGATLLGAAVAMLLGVTAALGVGRRTAHRR